MQQVWKLVFIFIAIQEYANLTSHKRYYLTGISFSGPVSWTDIFLVNRKALKMVKRDYTPLLIIYIFPLSFYAFH